MSTPHDSAVEVSLSHSHNRRWNQEQQNQHHQLRNRQQRRPNGRSGNSNSNSNPNSDGDNRNMDPDLDRLEYCLSEEVDADLFEDPRTFRTLQRVIDVLGAQLLDDGGGIGGKTGKNAKDVAPISPSSSHLDDTHDRNPAYLSLRKQRTVVEDAIEYLAENHCADLNSSAARAGTAARRFGEAVDVVRGLRRQVDDIRDNLSSTPIEGSGNGSNDGCGEDGKSEDGEYDDDDGDDNDDDDDDDNGNGKDGGRVKKKKKKKKSRQILPMNQRQKTKQKQKEKEKKQKDESKQKEKKKLKQKQQGRSLRELWLKKLEHEAVLSLLSKIETVRNAPHLFDQLVTPSCSSISMVSSTGGDGGSGGRFRNMGGFGCRVGAAAVLLREALDTAFSEDVSGMEALSGLTSQIMARKERADEMLWNTLNDVLYLRTADLRISPPPEGSGGGCSLGGTFGGGSGQERTKGTSGSSIRSSGTSKNGNERKRGTGRKHRSALRHHHSSSMSVTGSVSGSVSGSVDGGSIRDGGGSYRSGDGRGHRINARHGITGSGHEERSPHRFVSVLGIRSADFDGFDTDVDLEDEDITGANQGQGKNSQTVGVQGRNLSLGNQNVSVSVPPPPSTLYTPLLLLKKYMLDSEVDIEADEERCLKVPFGRQRPGVGDDTSVTSSVTMSMTSVTVGGMAVSPPPPSVTRSTANVPASSGPQYTDPILALRVLVESAVRLGRVDDVERVVAENVKAEIRGVARREQARSVERMEIKTTTAIRRVSTGVGLVAESIGLVAGGDKHGVSGGAIDRRDDGLKEFRAHLRSLLESFGGVLLRLHLLAQILRHRIVSYSNIYMQASSFCSVRFCDSSLGLPHFALSYIIPLL